LKIVCEKAIVRKQPRPAWNNATS